MDGVLGRGQTTIFPGSDVLNTAARWPELRPDGDAGVQGLAQRCPSQRQGPRAESALGSASSRIERHRPMARRPGPTSVAGSSATSNARRHRRRLSRLQQRGIDWSCRAEDRRHGLVKRNRNALVLMRPCEDHREDRGHDRHRRHSNPPNPPPPRPRSSFPTVIDEAKDLRLATRVRCAVLTRSPTHSSTEESGRPPADTVTFANMGLRAGSPLPRAARRSDTTSHRELQDIS